MPHAEAFRASRRSAGGGYPSTGPVRVPVEHQLVNNWCWLATTVSVARFHGEQIDQCSLANLALKETTCCAKPYSTRCNRRGEVDSVLGLLNHLANVDELLGVPPDLGRVRDELDSSRPAIGQFRFGAGAEHAILFAGYGVDASGSDFVRFGDPALGWNPTDVIWERARHYRGGIEWTYACWTS